MPSHELLAQADSLRARRSPFVLATVVRVQRPTSAKPGDCALVLPDGTIEGFVGGSCAESTVRTEGIRLLGTGEATLLRITPDVAGTGTIEEGVVTVGNPCLSGGTLEIFLEAQLPPTLVVVFGDAPVARALISVGRAIGYDVRVLDSPAALPADADAVLVASHGRDEEDVLQEAIAADVGYIGLIASSRRGSAVVRTLGERSELVHTPAGLDIGARTPAEIAVSVYAELITCRPRARLRDQPAPAEAPDPVCGMTVTVVGDSLQLPYEGKRYYFCGPGCRQAFADEPSRYVADA
ncbi:XdhC family protein [Amycolatopsis sp.]|uniref:XdhC family protein n=1 Tax=Amycolatopsis sp. TaxID=37632 RepID=UPI002CF67233|nr:XdhC family protein [Amycolatopsis sp.]HVV09360.1 XdhC family protein [Amycolatopsis sp.]